MRGWIAGMLLIAGCDEGATSLRCGELAREQPACMPDEAIAECEDAVADCDGEVAVLESCPLQFVCGP